MAADQSRARPSQWLPSALKVDVPEGLVRASSAKDTPLSLDSSELHHPPEDFELQLYPVEQLIKKKSFAASLQRKINRVTGRLYMPNPASTNERNSQRTAGERTRRGVVEKLGDLMTGRGDGSSFEKKSLTSGPPSESGSGALPSAPPSPNSVDVMEFEEQRLAQPEKWVLTDTLRTALDLNHQPESPNRKKKVSPKKEKVTASLASPSLIRSFKGKRIAAAVPPRIVIESQAFKVSSTTGKEEDSDLSAFHTFHMRPRLGSTDSSVYDRSSSDESLQIPSKNTIRRHNHEDDRSSYKSYKQNANSAASSRSSSKISIGGRSEEVIFSTTPHNVLSTSLMEEPAEEETLSIGSTSDPRPELTRSKTTPKKPRPRAWTTPSEFSRSENCILATSDVDSSSMGWKGSAPSVTGGGYERGRQRERAHQGGIVSRLAKSKSRSRPGTGCSTPIIVSTNYGNMVIGMGEDEEDDNVDQDGQSLKSYGADRKDGSPLSQGDDGGSALESVTGPLHRDHSVAASSNTSSIHTPVSLGPMQTRFMGLKLPEDMNLFFSALEDMVAESNLEEQLELEKEKEKLAANKKTKDAPPVKTKEYLEVCPWEDLRPDACPWQSADDISHSEMNKPLSNARRHPLSASLPTLQPSSVGSSKASPPAAFVRDEHHHGETTTATENASDQAQRTPSVMSSVGSLDFCLNDLSRSSSDLSIVGSVAEVRSKNALPPSSRSQVSTELLESKEFLKHQKIPYDRDYEVVGSLDSGYGSIGKLATSSVLLQANKLEDYVSEDAIYGGGDNAER
ncbi:hypothetical protein HDV05_001552 [Chytridiales sp. JEL 0842]|nr:hypothetical protein HDV05_001552 [Chytridiales sp. JEL 0842]